MHNHHRMRILLHVVISGLLVVQSWSACSLSTEELEALDPNLVNMKYDLGEGEQNYLAYITPDVSTFYKDDPPSSQPVVPKHKGKGAKFINLSNETVLVYWEPKLNDFDKGDAMVIRTVPPFSAKGTSTYPGHSFVFAKDDDTPLERFVVDRSTETLHPYDPYYVDNDDEVALKQRIAQELSPSEQPLYWKWRNTLRFDQYYHNVTGRSYMASFPRAPPMHYMWPAQYFDQEHWITTRERHFVKALPAEMSKPTTLRQLDDNELVALADYRTPGEDSLNMTLRVLSGAPRVFEISNFLSTIEVQHILEIAQASTLDESTLGDEKSKSRKVRTSRNSWVARRESPVIDAIYRRAADLMRIDEGLMRKRAPTEIANVPEGRPFTDKSIAEELQLVHYSEGQEYQTHHDFAYAPSTESTGSARFATLLLYLNDDMEGGETSFPKFLNAHTFLELKVKPEIGKAVLFYSQLPDGNMDEFSQHKAHIVRENYKWLINLWVWDPVRYS